MPVKTKPSTIVKSSNKKALLKAVLVVKKRSKLKNAEAIKIKKNSRAEKNKSGVLALKKNKTVKLKSPPEFLISKPREYSLRQILLKLETEKINLKPQSPVKVFLRNFVTASGAAVLCWMVLNSPYFFVAAKQEINQISKSAETSGAQEMIQTKILPELKTNEIYIPNLQIRAPIVYAQNKDESEFQKSLRFGVVHYPETVMPGEKGNCYIFGHSSDAAWTKGEYKTVFAALPQIVTGESIYISDPEGRVYVYKVYETLVVSASDTKYISENFGEKTILTLQTSYPVGTALKRYIVRAEVLE